MTEEKAPRPAHEPKGRKKPNPKNEGWIRWWGLGVFVGLTALLALGWLFLVDPFVKRPSDDRRRPGGAPPGRRIFVSFRSIEV